MGTHWLDNQCEESNLPNVELWHTFIDNRIFNIVCALNADYISQTQLLSIAFSDCRLGWYVYLAAQ